MDNLGPKTPNHLISVVLEYVFTDKIFFHSCLSPFMCRIKSIRSLESQGKNGSLQTKQITLVDNDGVRLKFLLWGEQVLLANLFR